MSRPSTFQEKLNVRILRDRRRLLVVASSKVLSKEYAASRQISELMIPRTYWSGTDVSEIDGREIAGGWVLKPSHRSGGVAFGEAGTFRSIDLRVDVGKLLKEREYRTSKLWGYKKAPRELLLEERLPSDNGDLKDYKFFVFHGVVSMIQVDSARFGGHFRVLYTPEWEPRSEVFGVERGESEHAPSRLKDMLRIASQLASEFDFVRVDLYLVKGQIYFGELTVYPGGGLSRWPASLDTELGSLWNLPTGITSGPNRARA
ncbi:ATP-grasp fold amidoligase family protein [Microbacterium sp.]|uniref:ATP-grasp fold amidoligase family protein n=1 Tax=Microbacterium sp. TaxID=51671 RepID=UPI00273342A6|nr:ATP-grasp fold amidoligase family protein [Microbacterium sp.]MDP3949104.1 ATP-grasp fold amidoligase family protein [Microbacterium sp.]